MENKPQDNINERIDKAFSEIETELENIENADPENPLNKKLQYKVLSKYLALFTEGEVTEHFKYKNEETKALDITESIKEINTPSGTTVLIDKLTYALAGGLVPYRVETPFKMEKGRSKKAITTFITLDMEDIEDVLPDNIGSEDINLLEAIISLIIANVEQGMTVFTLNDIYRVERKNLDTRPNKQNQQQLKDRILKLMRTLITIDSSEEKNSYYPDLMYKETGNLLNAHFLEVDIKGNRTMAIKVLDTPILYKYSQAKKQLTNVPFILTDNQLRKTESVLTLEKYLSRRIAQMRNSKKMTRNILYSTIYENMDFNQKTSKAREKAKARTRINIEEILKGFMAKEYIKNYKIEKQGRNQYHRLIIELYK